MYTPELAVSNDDNALDFIMLTDARDDQKAGPSTYASLQIIQLVEGPPPPPRRVISDDTSSYSSSSYTSDEDDEEGEGDESYCSSDEEEDDLPPDVDDEPHIPSETYPLRMKRILAWREDFSSHLSATISDTSLSSISPSSSSKRKLEDDDEDSDAMSQSSKRSRTSTSTSLGAHSCPACDTSFDSPQSLRQHGKNGSNEACIVAVEYAFE